MFRFLTLRRLLAGSAVLLGLLYVTIFLVNPADISGGLLFAGRLHPVVVHLPIGFLIIAGLLELLNRNLQSEVLDGGILLVLALTAVAAVIAAVSGNFLSLTGGYNSGHMTWHKWSGIVVASGSVAAAVLKFFSRDSQPAMIERGYQAVLLLSIFALLPAGHFGGTLTHGAGYLTEYLPLPVKTLLGGSGENMDPGAEITHIDSAVIFTQFVQPTFEQRCVECHGESKMRADLRLDSREGILQGGENGPVIQAGQPEDSELIRRISMPLQQKGVMPPKEHPPLTIEQVELIRWWVQTGADFEMKVAATDQEDRPSSVQTVLTRLSPPESGETTSSITLTVDPPDTAAIRQAQLAGIPVKFISQTDPYLQVNFQSAADTLRSEHFKLLKPLAEQIIWIDCSGKFLTNEAVSALSEFTHLMKLHLELTNITDRGLSRLSHLSRLTYLNLYGTDVTDQGLSHLHTLKNLETLYLWQTEVTEAGVESLRKQLKTVEANIGNQLIVVSTDSV